MVLIGGIILGFGLSLIPAQDVVYEWSSQQAGGSIVQAFQITFLVSMVVIAFGVMIARPGVARALGLGGFGFILAIAVIAAIGYLLIGSLLGGG